MENLKTILRNARISQGLRLREVSAKTDIDQTIINKFELGDRVPSRTQLELLSKCYNLNYKELIIIWKSDLLYNELKDEKYANQILKVAEEKIKYGEKNKK